MDICDHYKQGLELEIAPEIQHDPDSEVTDGCGPSKSALDKHEVSHEKFDIDANYSSKQGQEPEISTENQKGPQSEVTDGGNTSINVPGVNIGTDVISPGEGDSDDEINESTVLSPNPPLTGKLLMYQKYLESKQKQEEEKKKKREKETKKKMTKKQKKNQEKLLPTAKIRTGKLASRVNFQCLYPNVFTTYLCHFLPNDLHLLKNTI